MKKQLKYLKENWKQLLLLIIVNFVLVIVAELFWRKSMINITDWVVHYFPVVLLNVFIVLIVSILITLVTRKYAISFIITSNLVLIIALINAKKIALRNVPLILDDVHLFNEVKELIPQFATFKTFALLGFILSVVIFVSYFIIRHADRIQIKRHHLVHLSILSTLFILLSTISFGNETDISSTGLIVSLINDARFSEEQAYNKEEVEDLFETMYKEEVKEATEEKKETEADKFLKTESKPNVIVIQSEAFWDVNKLGLNLSENPIQTFYDLRDESVHGYMYVPVIGGGTVNTEFEILTGMTLKNYDYDSYMVYPNDIKGPTSSLASIFRKEGYYSLATHPFNGWYYNRAEVFKNMGFNEFKSLEFMENIEKLGSYVTDDYITDEIIHNIEAHKEPLFNLVLTMQNHAPFNDWRFKRDELLVTMQDQVSGDSVDTLNNYINSLYLTDQALKKLTDYLRASNEPTVILFYGDHLPYMGDDYYVYRDTGYLDENELFVHDNMDMMTTPFVIWSNYSTTEVDLGILNASYLPAYLVEKLGIDGPMYLEEVYKLSKETPLFTRNFAVNSLGEEVSSDSQAYLELMKKYFVLSSHKDDLTNEESLKWLITQNLDYNKDYDMEKVKKPE